MPAHGRWRAKRADGEARILTCLATTSRLTNMNSLAPKWIQISTMITAMCAVAISAFSFISQRRQNARTLQWQQQQAKEQLAWQEKQSVAALAWRERSERERLRFDLYSRRFAIYEKTLTLYHALNTIARERTPEFDATLRAFIGAKQEAQFLFDPSSGIASLLNQLYQEAFKIIAARELPPESPRRHLLAESAFHATQAFDVALGELVSAMGPYLNFKQIIG